MMFLPLKVFRDQACYDCSTEHEELIKASALPGCGPKLLIAR